MKQTRDPTKYGQTNVDKEVAPATTLEEHRQLNGMSARITFEQRSYLREVGAHRWEEDSNDIVDHICG